MSKYNEDPADKMINSNKLKSLFDLPDNDNLPNTISEKDIIEDSNDIKIDRKDPDDIIYDNIERANRLLDKIEDAVENDLTARLMEVASALINSITQASSSIVGSSQHDDELRYKERVLELKEREVMVKESLGKGGGKTVNNVLVTSREDLLNMINGKEEAKEINQD